MSGGLPNDNPSASRSRNGSHSLRDTSISDNRDESLDYDPLTQL
jgi:hypothetical protein